MTSNSKQKKVMVFTCMLLLAIVLASNADFVTDKFHVNVEQAKETAYSHKNVMLRQLHKEPDKCGGQVCEDYEDCLKYGDRCACSPAGECYLEIPCEYTPCTSDTECLDWTYQLCKCPEGGGMCYDELAPSYDQ